MLIDWITLHIDRSVYPAWQGWEFFCAIGDRIIRIDPAGNVVWETTAWDSIRSDSHQITIRPTPSSLWIQGSPARVMGDGDAVFGNPFGGDSLKICAESMLAFVAQQFDLVDMPPLSLWQCSRVDITCNYLLGSLADVRVALRELRGIEGGRYRVSQQAGDTVYWSHRSKRRSGKAYAKGPHLVHLQKQSTYTGRSYLDADMVLADRLLRLELKLGSNFFSDLRKSHVDIWSLPVSFWSDEHLSYFGRMVGDIEVDDMQSLLERLRKLPNPRREGFIPDSKALAVYRTWSLIQSTNWQFVRELMPRATFYEHLSLLKQAGLSDGDFSAGRVISLRRRILMQPVSSWSELRKVA